VAPKCDNFFYFLIEKHFDIHLLFLKKNKNKNKKSTQQQNQTDKATQQHKVASPNKKIHNSLSSFLYCNSLLGFLISYCLQFLPNSLIPTLGIQSPFVWSGPIRVFAWVLQLNPTRWKMAREKMPQTKLCLASTSSSRFWFILSFVLYNLILGFVFAKLVLFFCCHYSPVWGFRGSCQHAESQDL